MVSLGLTVNMNRLILISWVLTCLMFVNTETQGAEEVVRPKRTLVGTHGQDNELVKHTDIHNHKVNTGGSDEDKEDTTFVTSLEESGGRRCVKKVMMVEETVFGEVETCNHSYDKKCLTSYITRYEAFQEEECGEQFKKSCFIKTEKKSVTEIVEVCKTPIVEDCNTEGEEYCRTVSESECWTKYQKHEVRHGLVLCFHYYDL